MSKEQYSNQIKDLPCATGVVVAVQAAWGNGEDASDARVNVDGGVRYRDASSKRSPNTKALGLHWIHGWTVNFFAPRGFPKTRAQNGRDPCGEGKPFPLGKFTVPLSHSAVPTLAVTPRRHDCYVRRRHPRHGARRRTAFSKIMARRLALRHARVKLSPTPALKKFLAGAALTRGKIVGSRELAALYCT